MDRRSVWLPRPSSGTMPSVKQEVQSPQIPLQYNDTPSLIQARPLHLSSQPTYCYQSPAAGVGYPRVGTQPVQYSPSPAFVPVSPIHYVKEQSYSPILARRQITSPVSPRSRPRSVHGIQGDIHDRITAASEKSPGQQQSPSQRFYTRGTHGASPAITPAALMVPRVAPYSASVSAHPGTSTPTVPIGPWTPTAPGYPPSMFNTWRNYTGSNLMGPSLFGPIIEGPSLLHSVRTNPPEHGSPNPGTSIIQPSHQSQETGAAAISAPRVGRFRLRVRSPVAKLTRDPYLFRSRTHKHLATAQVVHEKTQKTGKSTTQSTTRRRETTVARTKSKVAKKIKADKQNTVKRRTAATKKSSAAVRCRPVTRSMKRETG